MTDQEAPQTERTPALGDRNGRLIAGAGLVIAGIGLFALEAVDGAGDAAVLLAIGAVFMALYFMRRLYGLLVAGSIILGVGLGQLLERLSDLSGDVNVIGIGTGFVGIYLIDRLTHDSAHWWPLIPGGILLVIGISSVAGASADLVFPALLVVAGVALVVGAGRRRE